MDHFKSLYWICYHIVYVLCFVLFAKGLAGSQLLWPGIEPKSASLEGKSLNHWTTREASFPFLFKVVYKKSPPNNPVSPLTLTSTPFPPPPTHMPFLGTKLEEGERHSPQSCQSSHSHGQGITVSSVQSLSHIRLFVTPWMPAFQASLSVTDSQSLLRLISIESVMPSNHLILCRPRLLLPSIFPSIRVFSNESVLCIRWPKYWSFSFSLSPCNEYSGLISFRMSDPCLTLYVTPHYCQDRMCAPWPWKVWLPPCLRPHLTALVLHPCSFCSGSFPRLHPPPGKSHCSFPFCSPFFSQLKCHLLREALLDPHLTVRSDSQIPISFWHIAGFQWAADRVPVCQCYSVKAASITWLPLSSSDPNKDLPNKWLIE